MQMWAMESRSVLTRSFLINFAPIILHGLELFHHSPDLIVSYRSRPWKIMMIFPIIAASCLYIAIEFTFPTTEDTQEMDGISEDEFFFTSKLVAVCMLVISYAVLYMLILRKSFFSSRVSEESNEHTEKLS